MKFDVFKSMFQRRYWYMLLLRSTTREFFSFPSVDSTTEHLLKRTTTMLTLMEKVILGQDKITYTADDLNSDRNQFSPKNSNR